MTDPALVDPGLSALQDPFRDPIVLPIRGDLCVANVQTVVRALGRAAGISASAVFQLIIGASELAGSLLQGPPRDGRIILRLLRNRRSVGMEIVLECAENGSGREARLESMKDLLDGFDVVVIAGGGGRLVARKWDPSGPGSRADRRIGKRAPARRASRIERAD